jgi:hypothetical protein
MRLLWPYVNNGKLWTDALTSSYDKRHLQSHGIHP